ncbi:uncharacterized protein LOC136081616 [Hydra vulgaris]|uniref:Uncharacterized protein LOC136081616 n=1 Tax=Hydra vulgaris TaxID=6087 RepID=A0ABM4C0T2_HYDVU
MRGTFIKRTFLSFFEKKTFFHGDSYFFMEISSSVPICHTNKIKLKYKIKELATSENLVAKTVGDSPYYSFKATSWAVTFASSELMYEQVNAETSANIRRWKTKKTSYLIRCYHIK